MQQKVCQAHFNACTQERPSELAAAVATCLATGMPRRACSSEQHQLVLTTIEETKEEVRGARKDGESEAPTRQDCESNSGSSDGGNDEAVGVINEAEFDSKGLHVEREPKARSHFEMTSRSTRCVICRYMEGIRTARYCPAMDSGLHRQRRGSTRQRRQTDQAALGVWPGHKWALSQTLQAQVQITRAVRRGYHRGVVTQAIDARYGWG